jgi:plastocyanin
MKMPRSLGAALVAVVVGGFSPATAQSVSGRTPNLEGGWTAPRGVVQLNLVHRFSMSERPLRKVTNTPTFHVGTGLTDQLMVGFTYGSNSTLVAAYPNEWEFFARALPLSEVGGAPLDVSLQGGYNVASESADGELLVARSLGSVKLLAAGRAFSSAYAGTETRFAVTGGAVLHLTPSVAIAGDYGALFGRDDSEVVAWSAGVQLGVPYTPHSLSIHATNVGTASLEGSSRGSRTRWGFEYTIPITLRRYVRSGGGGGGGVSRPDGPLAEEMDESSKMPAAAMGTADTVYVGLHNLAYQTETLTVVMGTTVVWLNMDPVQHSVVADDETFDSGLIDPEKTFSVTFTEAGEHGYHCRPHPFMKATVVVRDAMDEPAPGADWEEDGA